MKKYDYLIVGQGLAGTILACRLLKEGKQVFVIDSIARNAASNVAPGMYNPMVLKRFTKCWNVEKQLPYLYEFLDEFEKEFECKIHDSFPLYRLLHSVSEQNLWYESSDKTLLSTYMSDEITSYENPSITANFGLGEVKHSGRVHIKEMIAVFREHLLKEQAFLDDEFDCDAIVSFDESHSYKGVHFDKIIFCEGFSMLQNPYFSYLPLMGTKGELIEIHAPELKLDKLIKGAVFIFPLGNDIYKVGATFNWKDKTFDCTEEGKTELVRKLKTMINVPFTVVNQTAGIRPTVKDRRPLMGQHPKMKNYYIFNGMGTRGLLISPYLAKQMYVYLENGEDFDPECNINRYNNLFGNILE